MTHALIVDDDADAAEMMAALVAPRDSPSPPRARCAMRAGRSRCSRPTSCCSTCKLPDGNGMSLFDDPEFAAQSEVVLITGHASLETSIQALRLGATDYLIKPINPKQLHGILSRVMRPATLRAEIATMSARWKDSGQFGHLWGRSPPMERVYQQISRVAGTSVTRVRHRRERHRQGAGRAHRARPQPAPQAPVRRGQLRRDLAQPDRKRAVRPREGQLHRGRTSAPGFLRARARRHAVPRRDHRDAAGPAGQAAAGAGDRRLHARRLDPGPGGRRARDRGQQPPARTGGRRRPPARGSVVPPQCLPGGAAAVARSCARTSRCWPITFWSTSARAKAWPRASRRKRSPS